MNSPASTAPPGLMPNDLGSVWQYQASETRLLPTTDKQVALHWHQLQSLNCEENRRRHEKKDWRNVCHFQSMFTDAKDMLKNYAALFCSIFVLQTETTMFMI